MLIDIKQGNYLPFAEEAGIRVVLNDQGKMPFPFDEGFSVPPGFSTSVGVRRVSEFWFPFWDVYHAFVGQATLYFR